ncbi:MAG: anthranilate phosphoribosyltransferase [Bdellovibrionales bacterium]
MNEMTALFTYDHDTQELPMLFDHALQKVENGEDLTSEEAKEAFDLIFTGEIPDEHIAAFLLGLCKKGEAVEELLGAVISMRSKAITIKAPPDAIDIVGTGGDQLNTLNISTAASFVVAGGGVPVAKHGNRSVSSRSGASDVLRELGVNLEPDIAILEECLNVANICFLFAPTHHPAMRHVAPIRKRLGVRTIFNLLGPLTNPANVKLHLIGVYEKEWLTPMAEVLAELGSKAAWLVHGQDDMDEITTTAPTDSVELRDGELRSFTLTPEDMRLPRIHVADIYGQNAAENAIALRKLLNGERSPYRDIVLANAGAALTVAGKAQNILRGIDLAAESIDTGAATEALNRLVTLTNRWTK